MKQSTVMRLRFLVLGVVVVLGWRLVDTEETGQTSSTDESGPSAQERKWAPQFPREGATKVYEDDQFIVWDQIWPSGVHMHKHVNDILVIALESGGVTIVQPDGTESGVSQLNQGEAGFMGRYAAGLGPHAETAADPSNAPRAIFIELKDTRPEDCSEWSLAC